MTDNEIIKALECCARLQRRCDECPDRHELNLCGMALKSQALKLINRQKEEIRRLKEDVGDLEIKVEHLAVLLAEVRHEAVKEFAERAKKTIHDSVYQYWNFGEGGYYLAEDVDEDIDNLVKEFTEGKADE